MKAFDIVITIVYALLLAIGGLMGYTIGNSSASLIAGSVSALLMAFASWGLARKSSYAIWMALITSSALLLFFSYRSMMTSKFFPSGLMAILSALITLYLGWRLLYQAEALARDFDENQSS